MGNFFISMLIFCCFHFNSGTPASFMHETAFFIIKLITHSVLAYLSTILGALHSEEMARFEPLVAG